MATTPKPKKAANTGPKDQDTVSAQDTLAGQDTPTPPVVPAEVITKDTAPALVEVPVLQVVGPAKGRWRIMRKFTPEVTVIELTELTDDQVQALKDDPELTVIEASVSAVQPAA